MYNSRSYVIEPREFPLISEPIRGVLESDKSDVISLIGDMILEGPDLNPMPNL
jgi:hypothetical protein